MAFRIRRVFAPVIMLACGLSGLPHAHAQVNVTTYHNDNSRTGQNTQETILTPANVNSTQFGKLFSVTVVGAVYAQPLYLSAVTIAGGTHNVLYVVTEHDNVYAIDADSGTIYKTVSLIPSGGNTVNSSTDLGCGDLVPEVGITGTPVIDSVSGTLYVVAKSNVGGSIVQYLHALDVATLAEKFNGPVNIHASVPGSGYDSSAGVVAFNAKQENQRAALLLENNHVVIGWSSHCDSDPWHGWVMSYNATSLQQEGVFNTSPNGSRNGIWMSGGGIASDANGNLYFPTGNGTWNGTTDFGDSIVKLGPPASGSFPVLDYFSPYNQASLASSDEDVSSGGLVLLPPLASGTQLLAEQGKAGWIYLININNMGKYCPNLTPACTSGDPQIVQEMFASTGIWGSPAYWNGNLYWTGANDHIKAFSFNAHNSGLISTSPTSKSAQIFAFSAPTPTISASGNTNGILWALDGSADDSTCDGGGSNCLGLYAYDATNLANVLYISSQAANNRDSPGAAVKFEKPIVANGKVYVGTQSSVTVYGLLGTAPPPTATPTFTPPAGTYSSAQSVTIADATPGATIYYTTNGTTPSTGSAVYGGAITVNSSETVQAIAIASGDSASAVGAAAYTITVPVAATPTFTPPAGTYSSAQSVTIADATPGATIYYTTNGTTPSTGSALYGGAITVSSSETVQAIAVASGYATSAVGSAAYTISSGGGSTVVNDGSGFASAAGLSLVSGSSVAGGALVLSNSFGQSRAAWYATPVNVQSFTTDFNFQITPAGAGTGDGFTFTLQNVSASAIGSYGGGLGYQGIGSSVAVKFDLYSNSGEGPDSTGFYTDGAAPTVPALDMTASGVNLHSGDIMHAHLTYNGTTLTLTLTDTVTNASFTTSTAINIPTTVGGNTAYAGFTAGTGGSSATQEILNWTYVVGGAAPTAATPTFTPPAATYSSAQSVTIADATPGATIYYTTNGTTPSTGSAVYGGAITVSSSETLRAIAVASGYTTSAVGSAAYTIALPVTATPSFTPPAGTYASAQSVTIADATPGAKIYYTTNGTMPSTGSAVYGGAITVNSSETLQAIAAASGYATSAVGAAAYTITLPVAATPSFTPPAGTYTSPQTVTIADATPGSTIYYTTNGTTPTTSSVAYGGGGVAVSSSETLQAIAAASGYATSAVGSAAYTISGGGGSTVVNDAGGFASAAGLSLVSGSSVAGGALVLSNSFGQGRAAWYATPVNVQSFTTDFNFQITPAGAGTGDGFTFALQNVGASAIGSYGGGLGYQGIGSSVAVKFDLYSNSGEGPDSTGFYTDGAAPTVPALDMTASGVNLHSGDTMHAHLTYNGTTLTLTLTDTVTNASFTASTAINIPTTVGGNTAYAGFTAGTGGSSATQEILNWTYVVN